MYIKKGTKIIIHLSQADILIFNIKMPTLSHIMILCLHEGKMPFKLNQIPCLHLKENVGTTFIKKNPIMIFQH